MNPTVRRSAIAARASREADDAKRLILAIHALAEPPMKEFESSRLLAEYLKSRGFTVEWPWRNIPTAFRAWCGKGKPVIGMLGEYDALPGCGEEEGQWGHGCYHNQLGVGAAVGAVVAAQTLAAEKLPGRVVFYGCPAEETMVGKVYMARDGAFRELDVCLGWHPGATGVNAYGGNAVDSVVYEFYGKTAHAAAGPHIGRSALDSAILMDVAANYLREHVPESVRIHSVIRRGGDAPNVVPAYAKAWYFVRAPKRKIVEEVRERLDDCARGAAMASGVRVEISRVTAIYERLPNLALHESLLEELKQVGPSRPTKADREEARRAGFKGEFDLKVADGLGSQGRASSDEDTVSWLAPLGVFTLTTSCGGAQGHHREAARVAGLQYGVRATLQAARVFAGVAARLGAEKPLLRKVVSEFRKGTRGFTFDPLVPKRQPVPVEAP